MRLPLHAPAHEALWPLRFISVEARSGVVLLTAAAIAIAWANSPLAYAYEALWHLKFSAVFACLPAHDPPAARARESQRPRSRVNAAQRSAGTSA